MGSRGLMPVAPLPTLSLCQIAKQQQQLIQQQHKINLLQQQIQVKGWESRRWRGCHQPGEALGTGRDRGVTQA